MKTELTLQQRIDLIENEIKILKAHVFKDSQQPWWQQIAGVFENDHDFEQIDALGRSIREKERAEAQS